MFLVEEIRAGYFTIPFGVNFIPQLLGVGVSKNPIIGVVKFIAGQYGLDLIGCLRIIRGEHDEIDTRHGFLKFAHDRHFFQA